MLRVGGGREARGGVIANLEVEEGLFQARHDFGVFVGLSDWMKQLFLIRVLPPAGNSQARRR